MDGNGVAQTLHQRAYFPLKNQEDYELITCDEDLLGVRDATPIASYELSGHHEQKILYPYYGPGLSRSTDRSRDTHLKRFSHATQFH